MPNWHEDARPPDVPFSAPVTRETEYPTGDSDALVGVAFALLAVALLWAVVVWAIAQAVPL